MAKTLEELSMDLHRLEAQQACRNLMGKYLYWHSAFRNYEYVELWAKRDDDILEMPWGIYRGYEGVRACYLNDHGDRSDPETQEHIKGGMYFHELDTECLEVAEDGMTARGCWISPGHETYVNRGRRAGYPLGEPVAEWCWGKYAVDFIYEGGTWKIWRLRLYPLFLSPFDKSWVEITQPTPDDFGFTEAEPPTSRVWVWSPTSVYPADQPNPPLPYKTYDDVGYCL